MRRVSIPLPSYLPSWWSGRRAYKELHLKVLGPEALLSISIPNSFWVTPTSLWRTHPNPLISYDFLHLQLSFCLPFETCSQFPLKTKPQKLIPWNLYTNILHFNFTFHPHLPCSTTSTLSWSPNTSSALWAFPHLPCLDSKWLIMPTPLQGPHILCFSHPIAFLSLHTYTVCSATARVFIKPISSDVTCKQVKEFSRM